MTPAVDRKESDNVLAATMAAADYVRIIKDVATTPISENIKLSTFQQLVGFSYPMQARLTLESGVPASTTDQTAKTTIYLTPYLGNQVAVYDGVSAWVTLALSADISLSLSGFTANKNSDIFVYNNAGSLALERVEWTNDTTRATALVLQDGVYVKSGETTRRYVGTIRTTGTTGQCEDSVLRRFVWNYYNRRPRQFRVIETTDTWTYSTTTWRSWNNSTANRVEVVIGVSEDILTLVFQGLGLNSSAYSFGFGIGKDSTSVNSADVFTSGGSTAYVGGVATYRNYPGIGYHYLQLLEMGGGGGTTTFAGDAGVAYFQAGASGEVMA